MKRIISLLMTVVMLLSSMLFVIPANASQENSNATAVNIDYIDALYFEKAPTIDGYVSEAEWGERSFIVEATDAATQDDTEPYNRFIFWRVGDLSDYSTWSYEVWFRWDENYFYVAAKVQDPDVHQLRHGCGSAWDGDAFQMKIDPEGPNAATGGQEFEVNENYTKPWSSEAIPGFIFGYVQIAGGFTEAWDSTADKGMTAFSRNALGAAQAVVAPAGSSFSSDSQAGITTYEIGIPWAYILNGENDESGAQISALTHTEYKIGRTNSNKTGGIGREFGISVVNLEDGNNPDTKYDAWMAWGSGICGDHQTLGARSATGSNSVMLSGDSVKQTEYQKYDPASLLDASFSTENWDKKGVFYDYFDEDFEKTNAVKYEDLTLVTYDDPADVSMWGGEVGEGDDPTITDIGGEHGNVLDFSDDGHKNFIQTTYGGMDYLYPTSFTLEFEVCLKSTSANSSYDSALGNLFGGAGYPDFYFCGFNFNNNKFEICHSDALSMDFDKIANANYDFRKDTWYRWRFQYDNESCTCRLWLDDLTTSSDDGDGWGKMIFNQRWRYFYATEPYKHLIWRMLGCNIMIDNVRVYNFASITDVEEATESSDTQGPGTATTTTTQTGGGEVAIDTSKVYKKDGSWHVPVFAKSEYATATQLSFSLEYDPAKSEFVGIEGLAEGTYTVTETEKGKVAVIIKDFAAIKALKAGDKYFEFVLKALDNNAGAADLGLKLSDSYVYTVTTGDAMTFIVIGGAFALAAAATVVVVRRKKEEE